MFGNTEDYEKERVKLKENLKSQVRNALDDINIQCLYGIYDVCGHVLNVSKHEFMLFTKGFNEQWCEKIACIFETGFDSILKVVFSIKNISMQKFLIFISMIFLRNNTYLKRNGIFVQSARKAQNFSMTRVIHAKIVLKIRYNLHVIQLKGTVINLSTINTLNLFLLFFVFCKVHQGEYEV